MNYFMSSIGLVSCTLIVAGCQPLQPIADSAVTSRSSSAISQASDATKSDSREEPVSEIRVLSPNGGEVLKAYEKNLITWTSQNLTGEKVNISVQQGDENTAPLGSQWIAFSIPISQGHYQWTPNNEIPVHLSDSNLYKIQIRLDIDPNSDNLASDVSDGFFRIATNGATVSPVREVGANRYDIPTSSLDRLLPEFMEYNSDNSSVMILTTSSKLSCAQNSNNTTVTYQTISGDEGCIETTVDHAAGSAYYRYKANVVSERGVVTIEWVMREVSCGPQYDTMEEVRACENRHSQARASYVPRLVAEEVLRLLDLFLKDKRS